jgi:hypothetical protein
MSAPRLQSFAVTLRGHAEPGEEVVPLVVDDDERGEVLHLDPPDGLHAEIRILQHLDLADAVPGEAGGGTADGAQVVIAYPPDAGARQRTAAPARTSPAPGLLAAPPRGRPL